jgi:hypothetical protein
MSRRSTVTKSTASWRWRAGVAVVLSIATGALATGIAYGFFGSSGGGTGSATVGTLALGVNAPASSSCDYANLTPGDLSGVTQCSLAVNYTGSVPAFVSLTVQISSTPGSGGGLLFNGSGSSGLTFAISDGQNSFQVPSGTGTTAAPCPAGSTCWTTPDDLASWYTGSTPSLVFTGSSPVVTWTVTPLFPTTAGNTFEGGSAKLTLTARAVQDTPNPLPLGCDTTSIGQSCPASGSFVWG